MPHDALVRSLVYGITFAHFVFNIVFFCIVFPFVGFTYIQSKVELSTVANCMSLTFKCSYFAVIFGKVNVYVITTVMYSLNWYMKPTTCID